MSELRLVFDVDALLDAALDPKGASGSALRRYLDRTEYQLVVSAPLLQRFEEALNHDEVRRALGATSDRTQRLATSLGVLALNVECPQDARDPGLTTASAAGAILVCLDADERTQGAHLPEILSPESVLELLDARALGARQPSASPFGRPSR